MAGARRPAPWSICCSVVAVESGVLRGAGAPVCVASGGCESVGFYAAPQQKLRAACRPLHGCEHNEQNQQPLVALLAGTTLQQSSLFKGVAPSVLTLAIQDCAFWPEPRGAGTAGQRGNH